MIRFVKVLSAISFGDSLYLEGTYISADESMLAPFVDDGRAIWCEDPTPPPEPDEPPAP